ncbi:MAG: type II toxin-antitoxin system RelE/ParE family toxin [Acidobacteria bacterium]|nr:type II toxin-antitoxin system RelE/ParE family toxin [Acidobacteriota bacterium]
MKRYEVLIVASADKELAGMQKVLRQRIIEKFEEIGKDPRGTDSKTLDAATYRVRVGEYRIVYNVNGKERKVVITRIRHRREVYRR